jgi:hypothetical protein
MICRNIWTFAELYRLHTQNFGTGNIFSADAFRGESLYER